VGGQHSITFYFSSKYHCFITANTSFIRVFDGDNSDIIIKRENLKQKVEIGQRRTGFDYRS